MIHHPHILIPKVAFIVVAAIVLVILHGVLSPEGFRIAVVVAIASFCCFVAGLYAFLVRALRNPNSRIAREMIHTATAPAESGYHAHGGFQAAVGTRGTAQSALRPSGVAVLDEERVQVVTRGEFVAKGACIEVVAQEGARVIVASIDDTANSV
ncbi:MAG: hypothetical protein GY851_08055 [bacterium]|nr:hypothetical protein [bacterium]